MRNYTQICAILLFLTSGCSTATTEKVLSLGSYVLADFPEHRVRVEAKDDSSRTISIGDDSLRIKPKRRVSSFRGSLGLYSGTNYIRKSSLVYNEGCQHFRSLAEAREWLSWNRSGGKVAVNESGLVLLVQESKGSLALELWQFYIAGIRPSAFSSPFTTHTLRGSVTSATRIADRSKSPITVEGVEVSGRAHALMQERGLSSQGLVQTYRNPQHVSRNQTTGYKAYYSGDPFAPALIVSPSGQVVSIGQ